MEKLDLVVQNPEDTSVMDHHPVAGKIAQIMQEKEQEINELHEQISKLQQQLEITTDNKVHVFWNHFQYLPVTLQDNEVLNCLRH